MPGADSEICIVNSDGTGLVAVTDNAVEDYSPAWSPDGSKIAFVSQGDIFTINPDGTGLAQVTNDPALDSNRAPNWSPDGTRIVFESDRDCLGCDTNDIYLDQPRRHRASPADDHAGPRQITRAIRPPAARSSSRAAIHSTAPR